MTSNKKISKTQRKTVIFNFIPIAIVLGVLGVALTIYIGYRASMSDEKLFSVSLLALFAGLLFESFRITDNWRNVIYIFTGTYFFSIFSLLLGIIGSDYNFQFYIEFWPYYFMFIFSMTTAIFNKDKVTAKLTEGISLLQSISIIYWAIDYGFINIDNWFAKLLLIIVFVFSLFSIVQSLSNITLSRTVRLTLSIWSSIIMLAFAIDNVYRVYQNEDIETTKFLSQGLYIGLQYFLLGISVIYVTQNYMLLAGFLPSKNGDYENDLKVTKEEHIERYSDKQVLIGHSILCILYTVTFYVLNYRYQILPRHTMIWLVFLTFPFALQLPNKLKMERSA